MRRLTQLLLFAGAIAVVCLLPIHKIASYDTWFHLRAGEWLLGGGGFPSDDPFSFTADERWINLNWVFQIPLAWAHRIGGAPGVTLLNALLLLGAFGLLAARAVRRGTAPEIAASLIALAALACIQRLAPRPETLSLLFLVLAITLCEEALAGRIRRLWLFPLLQLVWVNSEALFPLGLLILGAGLLESIRRRVSTEQVRPWLWSILASVVACFLNPYGVQGALLPLRFLQVMSGGASPVGRAIFELRSPFDPLIPFSTIVPFVAFGGIVLVIVILRLRQLDLFRLILLLAFGALAMKSVRNIPLFAVVGAYVALQLLAGVRYLVGGLTSDESYRHRVRGSVWLASLRAIFGLGFLFLAAGIVSSSLYAHLGLEKRFGLGGDPRLFPDATIRRLAAPAPPRLMNDHALGHYLIWLLGPRTRVFLDGRAEVYSRERQQQLQACLVRGALFDQFAERSEVRWALLGHRPGYLAPLIAELDTNPDWELVAYDNAAVLFERGSGPVEFETLPLDVRIPEPRPRSTLATWFDAAGRTEAQGHMARAEMLINLRRSGTAAAEAMRAVEIAPWMADGFNLLGASLIGTGRLEDASRALQGCLALEPDYLEAIKNLGSVEMARGEDAEAERWLRKARALDPRDGQVAYRLGQVLRQLERPGEAELILQDAARLDAWNPRPRVELARLCFAQQRYRDAARHYGAAAEHGAGYAALLAAAQCLVAGGRAGEAEPWFDRARAAAPTDSLRALIDSLRREGVRPSP